MRQKSRNETREEKSGGDTSALPQSSVDVIVEALKRVAEILEETYDHDDQGNRTNEAGHLSGADVIEALCCHEDLVFKALGEAKGLRRQSAASDEKIKTKRVLTVTVVDPDSQVDVEVEIRKMETGGMVGIDGSYLEQDIGPVYSPYDPCIRLDIPDDEPQ